MVQENLNLSRSGSWQVKKLTGLGVRNLDRGGLLTKRPAAQRGARNREYFSSDYEATETPKRAPRDSFCWIRRSGSSPENGQESGGVHRKKSDGAVGGRGVP